MTHCHPYHKREKPKKSHAMPGNRAPLILGVVLLAAGAAGFWFMKDRPAASLNDAAAGQGSVVVDPKEINLGTIAMSDCIAERTFAVRNEGPGALRIANLQTSCMCTSARLEANGKESPVFCMAGMGGGHHGSSGAAPRGWSMEIPAASEGTLRVYYDP